jgi:hypothetical protein
VHVEWYRTSAYGVGVPMLIDLTPLHAYFVEDDSRLKSSLNFNGPYILSVTNANSAPYYSYSLVEYSKKWEKLGC